MMLIKKKMIMRVIIITTLASIIMMLSTKKYAIINTIIKHRLTGDHVKIRIIIFILCNSFQFGAIISLFFQMKIQPVDDLVGDIVMGSSK